MSPRKPLRTLLIIPLITLLTLSPHLGPVPNANAKANYNVAIQNETLNPSTVAVHKGDSVVWNNQDPLIYQLYFQNPDGTPYALSPYLNPGDTYSLGFNACTSIQYTTINSPVTITGTVKVRTQGDVNGDGKVDIVDLVLVGSIFGSTSGSPNFRPSSDLNNDGVINIVDLALVGANFGATCG